MPDTFTATQRRALTRLEDELGRTPTPAEREVLDALATGLAIVSDLPRERIPPRVLEANRKFMHLLGIDGAAQGHAEYARSVCAPWH